MGSYNYCLQRPPRGQVRVSIGARQDIQSSLLPGNSGREIRFLRLLAMTLRGTENSILRLARDLFHSSSPPPTIPQKRLRVFVSHLALTKDIRQGGVACVTWLPQRQPLQTFSWFQESLSKGRCHAPLCGPCTVARTLRALGSPTPPNPVLIGPGLLSILSQPAGHDKVSEALPKRYLPFL